MVIQFSPLTDWVVGGGGGGHEGGFSRDPLPVVSAGGHREQFWQWHGRPLFDVVHPAFSLPTTASSTLKEGFGEAVVAFDVSEPCKFLSLDSCQKRSLWDHKEVDLTPHPVVSIVFQVGDAKKCPQALGLESLDLFSQSQPAKSTSHSNRRGWR